MVLDFLHETLVVPHRICDACEGTAMWNDLDLHPLFGLDDGEGKVVRAVDTNVVLSEHVLCVDIFI
jgi:hypothetical protein